MSQPLVTSYFNTRKNKRPAYDELQGKSKVLLLERNNSSSQTSKNTESSEQSTLNEEGTGSSPKIVLQDPPANLQESARTTKAVRNIRFDSPKASPDKVNRLRARVTRSRRLSTTDGSQTDIRDSLFKMGADSSEIKKVPFEKKGTLSPKKKLQTPKKSSATAKEDVIQKVENEPPAAGSLTPPSSKISTMERLAKSENLSFNDIKNKIKKSSRLEEMKAIMQRIAKCDEALEQLQKQDDTKKPQMQKFKQIELEILVSPQKGHKSPTKALSTPTKDRDFSKASSQRQLLFEPKEPTSSPVKCSPTKAYQRYLSLAESEIPGLALPYNYRFLAEVFRCMETVSAMLFNRGELITFNKLKPAVQELLRRNFTQEHLAQIKTIYPNAYSYHQEKHRNYGSTSKQERYELVLTPVVEANKGGITAPDADNILKTASENSMSPTVLLERKKKFYNTLLERVKDEHGKFLLSLGNPKLMNIPREKIMRWHPEFDVESCKKIEQAELPQPPQVEKTSAKDVLDKAKSLFNCGTRMEKALQRLAEANLTLKSPSSIQDSTTQTTEDGVPKVNIAIVDTPPATPSTQISHLNTLFKGIPNALLEKVRAKQAAKALEAMTRTPNANKEAALYSRLPEFAKLLRNIFVAEKKGVLPMEAVIQKLDNSYRTKLTLQEMEEHIQQLCKLLPIWTSIHNVRKVTYLKLDKNVELAKVIKRLEILADDKVKIGS